MLSGIEQRSEIPEGLRSLASKFYSPLLGGILSIVTANLTTVILGHSDDRSGHSEGSLQPRRQVRLKGSSWITLPIEIVVHKADVVSESATDCRS